jgi:hypothetical protein
VSVEAISWALNLPPVPANRVACKFVLVGLANHAGPDGTGAFPSVATLVRYTGGSGRDRPLRRGGCSPSVLSAAGQDDWVP